MVVLMVICTLLMFRMMGSMGGMGMCGFGRWREPREGADSDERTLADRPRTDIDIPD